VSHRIRVVLLTIGDIQAFGRILDQIAPLIYREGQFMGDWLQISEAGETFADYMNLDSYFRRQAARSVGFSPNTLKLIRGAMDLVFGFLPAELKQWVDGALSRDSLCVNVSPLTLELDLLYTNIDKWLALSRIWNDLCQTLRSEGVCSYSSNYRNCTRRWYSLMHGIRSVFSESAG
jgi:Exocyst complex component Sec3